LIRRRLVVTAAPDSPDGAKDKAKLGGVRAGAELHAWVVFRLTATPRNDSGCAAPEWRRRRELSSLAVA